MREWWRGGVIYQVYPRSFQDTNGDGVGDLPGIMRRLDHIASLGVDCIWLSPITQSPQADMGYDVSDYKEVDRLFGSLEDFDNLVERAYALGLKDLQRAIAASLAASTRKAWTIAGIATAIHIGTALLLFLPQPERVLELSALNLVLSAVPAADGWSQEVLFRGYVIFRLTRADVPAITQILISGVLFAAIHFGYAGETALAFLLPLVGTFMLGCFYAWAVRIGGGSLKPVICCHMLIIIVLQPWLALAR